ncbi:YusW family protein [Ammoniphilus sp. YIM 78166]|uniref:YusW family protein n=1 Tax=Ammoniphilus sp. YIM 78166 TaxID=1644106 RepID=UPI00106F6E99|nr:YusW family protein [Ammoniphilus sp. YIM 78166]
MKTKLGYISIGMVFTLILSFAWLTFADKKADPSTAEEQVADPSVQAEPPKEVVGQPVFIDQDANKIAVFDGAKKWEYTIDSGTTIYRNDQKVELADIQFTDEVQVILNSGQQVRYIRAIGEAQAEVAAAAPAPTSAPASVQPAVQAAAPVQKTSVGQHGVKPEEIEELKIKLEIGNKKYKLEYKQDDDDIESEIEIEEGKNKTKITGSRAVSSAEEILSRMVLTSDMDSQAILQSILAAIGEEDGQVRKVEIEIEFANGAKLKVDSEGKKAKGLSRAMENVQGTPAEAVIAELLKK